MNPWKCEDWKSFYTDKPGLRTGLRLHFEPGIDSTLRKFFLLFAAWLRKNYPFPIRVNVYIKHTKTLRAKDGTQVSATFFGPFDRTLEPYIRIAADDFEEIRAEHDTFSALCGEINSLAHELTHYYQWLNDLGLTEKQEERQAAYFSEKIVYRFIDENDI
ncbi:MAG: hypothetical protein IK990_06785 [Ruminiclostridium sp.]|nr:hypothetical protein [Ruminiclostridium sp.]